MNSSKVRLKYLKLMSEIEKRLEVLNSFSRKEINSLYLQATIESEALQIRKILELVAYSSLVNNKDSYLKIHGDISKPWKARKIFEKIESFNPDSYPVPVNGVKNGKWDKLKKGFLTKKQFENLYDDCGIIIHAKNPFLNSSRSSIAFHRKVPNYVLKIEKLLSQHCMKISEKEEIHVNNSFYKNRPKVLRFLVKR